MKKIFLLILPALILFSCEKDFTGIIDPELSDYQLSSINQVDSFIFSPNDSLITFNANFRSTDGIQSVSIDIISSAKSKLNQQPVVLLDNGNSGNGDQRAGDGIFSGRFAFSRVFPNGVYTVKYYITDTNQKTKLIAQQNFNYNNGQDNVAPVISNLVAPAAVPIGIDTSYLVITLDVTDENSLIDIDFVFFNSYLPDGSASSANPIEMYDDETNGDETAGDGTYTATVTLPPAGVTKGMYRWEFQARDRGELLSNKIIHNIEIQ